jgi:hypothetical protein
MFKKSDIFMLLILFEFSILQGIFKPAVCLEQWCPTTFFPLPLCIFKLLNLREIRVIYHYKSISEQRSVATFKDPVAACGEWRQGWTPLV